MKAGSATHIEAVVFDLGGVLIEFDFDRANRAAAGVSGLPAEEVRRRIFGCPEFLEFECGRIDPRGFHGCLQKVLEFNIPYELFCQAWNGIFKEEIASTVELARTLHRNKLKVGILSNTNVLHFEFLRPRMSILRELEHVYASHEIGCRKPEPAAYQAVLQRMNVAPSQAVFVDDLPENIAAAERVGMIGVHAPDAAAVRSGLTRLGLI